MQGTVVEYHREFCWVLTADGSEVIAKPRGRLELDEQKFARQLSVGDEVTISEPEPGHFVIDSIAERQTYLLRKSPRNYRNRPQCIVANADQLAVVVAPNPKIRVNLIDRYFLAAILGGLEPVLVVNKIDVDPELPSRRDLLLYRELGYDVFFSNAIDGTGMNELAEMLPGKITAFCGHSGVGKSTLLGRLTGQEILTGEVKEKTLQGRQTTVTARAYALPGGGLAVDTPGVREFGMHELSSLDVMEYFSDIGEYARDCPFRDCTHSHEPDCTVQKAISEGRLPDQRLKSYRALLEESDQKEWESKRR